MYFGGECLCVCLCREDWKGVCLGSLCLKLKAETKLVAASIDVLAIEESRQSQLNAYENTQVQSRLDTLFYCHTPKTNCTY